MIERTLVLLKPDTVARGLMGRVLQRFEDAGLKVVGMKMVWIDKDFAKKHYFDVAQRRGEKVLAALLNMITEGPVVATVIEGIHAVDVVRKMVGDTEPKSAIPGTIRGDFAHHSFDHTDSRGVAIKNLVHASGKKEEAEYEIKLWFRDNELHSYKTVHEIHTY